MEEVNQVNDTLGYYYVHQFFASGLLGVVFFLLGLLFAALLWGGARRRSIRLQEENRTLRTECQDLERMGGTL